MVNSTDDLPLISVIITTYNYANFLPKAIESVLNQTYKNFEIIVIDDGSTDNARSVIKESWLVKYFYQENKGISAARNAGIKKCKGDYIVFLDADDWLETDALEQNLNVIKDKPDIAFVSGNYYFVRAGKSKPEHVSVSVTDQHYAQLLCNNYIGMLAAVIFRQWVFKEFEYDESLQACEDYDLYLNIARKYPVIHHPKFIATYYFHTAGLSHRYKVMMDSIYTVIKKQAPHINSAAEKSAYTKGLEQWKDYYSLLQKEV